LKIGFARASKLRGSNFAHRFLDEIFVSVISIERSSDYVTPRIANCFDDEQAVLRKERRARKKIRERERERERKRARKNRGKRNERARLRLLRAGGAKERIQ